MSTSQNPNDKKADETSNPINTPSQGVKTGLSRNKPDAQKSDLKIRDPVPVAGNRKYELMMRNLGHYGIFFPRSCKAIGPTMINLQRLAMRDSIQVTLNTVIKRLLLHKKGHIQQSDIDYSTAEDHSNVLADGCMLMLYCRLRSLHHPSFNSFMHKPNVPANLEVPAPYAIAIQALGIFRVSSLTHELELMPSFAKEDTTNYLLGTNQWSLPAYQASVEFAKSLGIRFNHVDLSGKLGSAWWLFKSVQDGEDFQLKCCLPESNYTDEDAVIRALWCVTSAGSLHNEIADLSRQTMDRGHFMRNPPSNIALTCFYGMA